MSAVMRPVDRCEHGMSREDEECAACDMAAEGAFHILALTEWEYEMEMAEAERDSVAGEWDAAEQPYPAR